MDYDEEFDPTEEEIAAEEQEEPLMMTNAEAWDNFLAYVRLCQADWAEPDEDTDLYRKQMAVEYFNAGARACLRFVSPPSHCSASPCCTGNKVAIDLIRLKPTLLSWIPHVMSFVVPRQILKLGCPARRSADSCEAFGAWLKKSIKHRTCRRRANRSTTVEHVRKTASGIVKWKQHFRRGYLQQVFTKACVKERLNYGAENVPFLQRVDWKRLRSGKSTTKYDSKHAKAQVQAAEDGQSPMQPRNIKDCLAEQI